MDFPGQQKYSSRFKLFHELMPTKIRQIMLISTSYEAWIMEEDCRISEQIINEYRGLNLSQPPRLTWVSSMDEALVKFNERLFDLVIHFTRTIDDHVLELGARTKAIRPGMPVVLLSHQELLTDSGPSLEECSRSFDRVFFWSGQAEILLAIVKSIEDEFNAVPDTETAGVRIILFVEDSPYYLAIILPLLYKELVAETQAVIAEGLNEEHRLLAMRARPKILLAHSYEHAIELYEAFKPFVLGVLSDMRFYRDGRLDDLAGFHLLQHVKKDRFDIPLLLASSEPANGEYAARIPATFLDKNALDLQERIGNFLVSYLGFGNFIFRMPDGIAYDHAENLYAMEKKLAGIPIESFLHHARHNDFSRWFYTLAEVELASQVRPLRDSGFGSAEAHRQELISIIREKRIKRQRGVIVNFDSNHFDPDTNFAKTGHGSLGGKARGLAFFTALLARCPEAFQDVVNLEVMVPQTLVVTTDAFDSFIALNNLQDLVRQDLPDNEVLARFLDTQFPEQLATQLSTFLQLVHYPLAVRSSSILEDAQFKSYAGLYHTCMLANDHPKFDVRLQQLFGAIRRVYASTYFQAPKAFTRRVGNRTELEKMAVIIQHAVGGRYGKFHYPAVSGVAQSLNYYPFGAMKTEDGMVSIAMGFGKSVMDGERILRFSPRSPKSQVQRTSVRDILDSAQRHFYALAMERGRSPDQIVNDDCLVRRQITEAVGEEPLCVLAGSYNHDEQRIRDSYNGRDTPVLTFASILKYNAYPLAGAVAKLLEMGAAGLGCPVEIEFALNLPVQPSDTAQLAVLQLRPMSAREEMLELRISKQELEQAFCVCHQALGNTDNRAISDLVVVRPELFDPAKTLEIAGELEKLNSQLARQGRKYILIGPGRWGSADRWLGIPVGWRAISSVGAIIETGHPLLKAEPSQGSHFFHNIVSLGISYFNVTPNAPDRLELEKLQEVEVVAETEHVRHLRRNIPVHLKVDGSRRLGVLI
jgi:hypothetical protein